MCCSVSTADLEWTLVVFLTTWFQHKANPCHMEPKLHRVRVNKGFCPQSVSTERKAWNMLICSEELYKESLLQWTSWALQVLLWRPRAVCILPITGRAGRISGGGATGRRKNGKHKKPNCTFENNLIYRWEMKRVWYRVRKNVDTRLLREPCINIWTVSQKYGKLEHDNTIRKCQLEG